MGAYGKLLEACRPLASTESAAPEPDGKKQKVIELKTGKSFDGFAFNDGSLPFAVRSGAEIRG